MADPAGGDYVALLGDALGLTVFRCEVTEGCPCNALPHEACFARPDAWRFVVCATDPSRRSVQEARKKFDDHVRLHQLYQRRTALNPSSWKRTSGGWQCATCGEEVSKVYRLPRHSCPRVDRDMKRASHRKRGVLKDRPFLKPSTVSRWRIWKPALRHRLRGKQNRGRCSGTRVSRRFKRQIFDGATLSMKTPRHIVMYTSTWAANVINLVYN